MFKLKRICNQPVLTPVKNHPWEKTAVFNPAAFYKNGVFHLFYRAADKPFILDTEKPLEENKFTSSIGYAVSHDGIHFKRFDEPMLTGKGVQEAWGMEDPRVTKIGDTYYMVYTGFGGRDWTDIRISMVESKDLLTWHNSRILLDEPNKDGALLPEKINGRYFLFHRRIPSIWVSYSDDLINWSDHKVILNPRAGKWDSNKIGLAGTPVKIEDGWLMIYHGVDEENKYRLGAALLDKNDPSKVIAVQDEPILEPELDWEVNGLVPNVVFSCAGVIADKILYVFYGAADTVIGVAGIEVEKIKF
jgi:predicted GH43/DUF377 family glycosyl hydrolase